VHICVYNIKGNLVKNLIKSKVSTGSYSVAWDGTDNSGTQVSSGVYYLLMKANNYQSCKKMIMLK
jgi:flagellar hook assembly protein FlgD